MVEVYENNVLIDPSLILAENSIINTFNLIRESSTIGEKFKFYYPGSFQRLIRKEEPYERISGVKFFLHGAYHSDIRELNMLMKEFSNIVYEFVPSLEQMERYGHVHEMLSEELEYRGELTDLELLDILFEEWIFLQEYS